MKTVRTLIAASAMLVASNAQAAAITPADILAQGQTTFNALSDDLAAATWMNPSNSAESHSAGLIPVGVQAAVELTSVAIDSNDLQWSSMGYTADTLPVPRLRLSAGIPFGLDVGYMYLSSSALEIDMSGLEVRMAFGNYIPVPMLEANVRYHTSTLTAGSDMEVKNSGYAVMVGANLPMIKPYLEVGRVTSTSTPSGTLAAFTEYEATHSTMAVGAKLELALFVINLEKSKVGDNDLTTIKLGFEF
jgi:opacity protein-like surface antigen